MDELDKNDEKVFSQEELELGFVSTSLLFFFAGKANEYISTYSIIYSTSLKAASRLLFPSVDTVYMSVT